ncbi:MAG: aromatic ring-hydroxylating dioxygenase subunit alpha [Gammaproteobacteria bacterium]|nr:MAG: aromatic ring-hydroxylating dioxygenase subunit alpha [Gammaproteobacteria bacterium]
MYINFWYPVAPSEDITNDKPQRVRILSLDFVAFRDTAGNAHVLADTCCHRGAALGEGKIKGDCVECPYHGWQYNGAGQCTLIPSQSADEKPPARAKVDSYPVQEKYGILFAFLGDLPEDERPPMMEIEEYEAEDWRANILRVFDVDYYYERSVENGLDPAHNEFVHPKQGTPGMIMDFKKNPIQIDPLTDYGSGFMMPFTQVNPDGGLMADVNSEYDEIVHAGSGHVGPNGLVTWLHFSKEKRFHQYFFEAPIDENRTRIFFVNMRHFMMDPANDQRIVDINMEIAQEDIDLLVNLNPVRTPETMTKELLVPTDKPLVRYREYLKDWENRGWRIDMLKLAEERGNVASAIPCPQRRTARNWVLDEVPRV